jgi:hypothetical protein
MIVLKVEVVQQGSDKIGDPKDVSVDGGAPQQQQQVVGYTRTYINHPSPKVISLFSKLLNN